MFLQQLIYLFAGCLLFIGALSKVEPICAGLIPWYVDAFCLSEAKHHLALGFKPFQLTFNNIDLHLDQIWSIISSF